VTLAALTGICAAAVVTAPAAQATTTTACTYGYSVRLTSIPYPSPTVNLGTWCTGFADAGAPYVFHIDRLNAVYSQFPMNVYYNNVTATCRAYSSSGTALVATGCTYVF
jgi:hypothetical protein